MERYHKRKLGLKWFGNTEGLGVHFRKCGKVPGGLEVFQEAWKCSRRLGSVPEASEKLVRVTGCNKVNI